MKSYKSLALAAMMTAALSSSVYAEQKPVYDAGDGESRGVRVIYDYLSDSHYKLNTQMGYVNDIELKPGETVTYIAGGDTKRWMIDKAMVGNVQHIYIKPLDKGISTNIIVNTNQRSYRFDVVETDGYDPLVTFRFPNEPDKKSSYNNNRSSFRESDKVAFPRAEGIEVNRSKLNFAYTIRAKKVADKDLIPVEVFDDGEKTFIRMSKNNKYDLPVLYSIDPWDKNKLSMVNYRVKDGYYVADRVMEKGRLFYHQNFYVEFVNEKAKPLEDKVIHQDAQAMKRRMLRELDNGDDPWMNVSNERVLRETKEAERDELLRSQRMAARQAEKERVAQERAVRQQQEEQLRQQEAFRREQVRQQEAARREQLKQQEAMRREQERALREQAEAERIRQAEMEKARAEQIKAAEKERIAREKAAEKERIAKEKAALEEQRRIEAEQQRAMKEEAARQEAARKEAERRMREAEKAKEELAVLREKEAELANRIAGVTAKLNGVPADAQYNRKKVEEERQMRVPEQQRVQQTAARPAQRQPLVAQPGNRPLMRRGDDRMAVLNRSMMGRQVVLQNDAGERRAVPWEQLPEQMRINYLTQMLQQERAAEAQPVKPYDVNYEQYGEGKG